MVPTNLDIWTDWPSYASVDRRITDTRLTIVCIETGRVLAACINQDALDAATRLLGTK